MNMNFPMSQISQSEFVKTFWRIYVATGTFQIVGATIAVVISRYGDPFLDLWYGGAASTLPGFIIGIIWQFQASKEKFSNNFSAVGFLGILASILTLSAFIAPLEEISELIKTQELK